MQSFHCSIFSNLPVVEHSKQITSEKEIFLSSKCAISSNFYLNISDLLSIYIYIYILQSQ